MPLNSSLFTVFDEDDELDLIEFLKFREDCGELSDDEIDYEREEEENQRAAVKFAKKRKFMNRVYDGYNPAIALNSEWYLKYV